MLVTLAGRAGTPTVSSAGYDTSEVMPPAVPTSPATIPATTRMTARQSGVTAGPPMTWPLGAADNGRSLRTLRSAPAGWQPARQKPRRLLSCEIPGPDSAGPAPLGPGRRPLFVAGRRGTPGATISSRNFTTAGARNLVNWRSLDFAAGVSRWAECGLSLSPRVSHADICLSWHVVQIGYGTLAGMTATGADAETLAAGGLDWLLGVAGQMQGGLVWTGHTDDAEVDPTLYSGAAGIVITLLEAYRHFGDVRYADAAIRGSRAIASAVAGWELSSLYFGLTGMAVALQAVAGQLGDLDAGRAAGGALARVKASFDGERWGPQFELLGGNAGIALGALGLGDVELAEMAVTPYLRAVEVTPAGVTWENREGLETRRHHISHGTLGVAYALAATAQAAGRTDLMDLALAGVNDVVARNEAGPSGFLVPHSDPQQDPARIQRYSYAGATGQPATRRCFACCTSSRPIRAGRRWRIVAGTPSSSLACPGGSSLVSGTTTGDAAGPPEFSRWPVTARQKAAAASIPRLYSSTISGNVRRPTPPGCTGRTTSTASPPAPWRHGPAGPWGTPGSSGNCSGSPVLTQAATRGMPSPGPTILRSAIQPPRSGPQATRPSARPEINARSDVTLGGRFHVLELRDHPYGRKALSSHTLTCHTINKFEW